MGIRSPSSRAAERNIRRDIYWTDLKGEEEVSLTSEKALSVT